MLKEPKQILYVDDDENLRTEVARVLEEEGYLVLQLPDPTKKFEVLKDNKVDLIILDLMMPYQNGVDALKELKSNPDTKDIPVVMFSNIDSEEILSKCLNLGAAEYVVKSSFTVKEFLKVVSGYLPISFSLWRSFQNLKKSVLYKNKSTPWIRIFFILPGALLVSLLVLIPLHLVLYVTLTGFIDPYPDTPERILSPFVISLVFIYSGAKISPFKNYLVGKLLFLLYVIFWTYFVILGVLGGTFMGSILVLNAGGISAIGALLGAFLGLYLIKKKA